MEEQLDVDGVLDQHAQQTRSDKNQRCAKRGRSNTKTELQVVRFPEQIRSVLDMVGLAVPMLRVWCFGIAVVRSDGCVGFVFEDTS